MEKTKVSKAQQKAVNKYVKNNYDRINVTLPKGKKEIIEKAAAESGESVNGYIKTAINERMERQGFVFQDDPLVDSPEGSTEDPTE